MALTNEVNVTASVNRGFRAANAADLGGIGLSGGGGFEIAPTTAASLGAFVGSSGAAGAVSTGVRVSDLRPEVVSQYELGLKARPMPWLNVNASVYRNHWTDLQLPFTTSDKLFGYLQNAGKATSTGAEVEVAARPRPDLRLALNLATVDARMDETVFDASGNAGAVKGNHIPFSPRLQASVSAAREFELRSGLVAEVSGRYAHRGATYGDPSNNGALKNDASDNLTLKAGVHDGTWGTRVFVSNATNSSASLQKTTAPGGTVVVTQYVQPRTIGLEIDASF